MKLTWTRRNQENPLLPKFMPRPREGTNTNSCWALGWHLSVAEDNTWWSLLVFSPHFLVNNLVIFDGDSLHPKEAEHILCANNTTQRKSPRCSSEWKKWAVRCSLKSTSVPSPITVLLKVVYIRLCHLWSDRWSVYAFRGVSALQGTAHKATWEDYAALSSAASGICFTLTGHINRTLNGNFMKKITKVVLNNCSVFGNLSAMFCTTQRYVNLYGTASKIFDVKGGGIKHIRNSQRAFEHWKHGELTAALSARSSQDNRRAFHPFAHALCEATSVGMSHIHIDLFAFAHFWFMIDSKPRTVFTYWRRKTFKLFVHRPFKLKCLVCLQYLKALMECSDALSRWSGT